jgi:biotin operon repressor
MKRFAIFSMLAASLIAAQTAEAQTETQQQAQTQSSTMIQATAAPKKMGFRLTEWKTIHSHSQEEAQETIAALEKIGCEVTSGNHGNHIDVNYRCPEWKSMKLATDQLGNQWATWCGAKGMETVIMNPPANTQKATVKFRMPVAKTVHLHDATAAKQIINTLKLIGCEVQSNQHGDHMDATFSCPEWITIEVPTDANAHSWQKWLDESGFETQHTH